MPNGDKHETGIVQALPDDRIRDILEACFYHHVIPLMLVLNHTEGHFYGVNHGQTFLDWHAQPGPEMRARRDDVHAQVGLPILDGAHYEPESFEAVAKTEESAILEDVGHDVYASGSQDSDVPAEPVAPAVTRVLPRPADQVHPDIYERLLRTPDTDALSVPDRRIVQRLTEANRLAFEAWRTSMGPHFKLPLPDEGCCTWAGYLEWLVNHPAAIRHALAYLPFPELAAQCCSVAQLQRWGELEVYRQQIQTLECIADDDDSDDRARHLCREWLHACSQADEEDALDIARAEKSWQNLGALVDGSLLRNRPHDVPVPSWFILHVLPYAVRDWTQSAMGRTASGARAIWHKEYPEVAKLCMDIEQHRDWSKTTMLPLGVARGCYSQAAEVQAARSSATERHD